jgi:hypothetical protein
MSMNDLLERTWKEAVVAYFKVTLVLPVHNFRGIFLNINAFRSI